MLPIFFRKVKTQAEKDELLRQARATYEKVPIEHQHIFASSDTDFLCSAAENIEIEQPLYVRPGELTSEQLARQDGMLNCMKLFGERADSGAIGIPALDELWKSRQESELAKLLEPGKRVQSELDGIIEAALAKVLAKGRAAIPPRESERPGITPFAKRASTGARIEYDSKSDESTEYGVSGALVGSWRGRPNAKPSVAA